MVGRRDAPAGGLFRFGARRAGTAVGICAAVVVLIAFALRPLRVARSTFREQQLREPGPRSIRRMLIGLPPLCARAYTRSAGATLSPDRWRPVRSGSVRSYFALGDSYPRREPTTGRC
jgi:hypothetical protein